LAAGTYPDTGVAIIKDPLLACLTKDLIFAGLLTGMAYGVGLPFTRLLPSQVHMRALSAPALGIAALAIAATVAYRFGIPPQATACAGAAIAIVSCFLFRSSLFYRTHFVVAGGAALVFVFCLAPKWVGGDQFAAFQGNPYDHFSYIAEAVTFSKHPYYYLEDLKQSTFLANDFMGWVGEFRDARPGVAILYSGLARLIQGNLIALSYTYLATLQAMFFPAALFTLVNIWRMATSRLRLAVLISVAATVGFPLQYIVDMNAWSELISIQIALIVTTIFIILMDSSDKKYDLVSMTILFSPMLVALAGILYLYPEILTVYLVIVFVSLTMFGRCDGVLKARRPVIVAATALSGALLLCLPYLPGTLGFLWTQTSFASVNAPNWWTYFQRYLLTDDTSFVGVPASLKYTLLGPIDIGIGVIGLYFLRPHGSHSFVIALLWEILVGVAFFSVLWTALRAYTLSDEFRAKTLATATLVSAVLLGGIALTGRLWAAGKGVSMLAPLIFLCVAAPTLLLSRKHSWERVPAWLLVVAYVGFGVARPIMAATDGGIGYPPPYPGSMNPEAKRKYAWDLPGYEAELRRCRAISLDIDEPVLERYAQLYLTDLDAHWSTVRPINPYFGIGKNAGMQVQVTNPDCLVSTNPLARRDNGTVISLARDKRVVDFFEAPHGSLDVAVSAPAGIEVTGTYEQEFVKGGALRWSAGRMRVLVPNNPSHPAQRLSFAIWPVASPNRNMTIQVNGALLYAGKVVKGATDWPLPPNSSSSLEIVLSVDTIRYPGDPRDLGIPLRTFTVTK
jgi:hypothetical protein